MTRSSCLCNIICRGVVIVTVRGNRMCHKSISILKVILILLPAKIRIPLLDTPATVHVHSHDHHYGLGHGCANHDTEEKCFKSPIHCCDVTKPPYLFSGELRTSLLHCELLFVFIVCCRRTGQCFSVLRTRQ